MMMTTEPARVPVRTILATIGLLLGTGLAVLFVIQVQRVLVWMLVAGFFTVTLYPVVAWVQRRLSWCPRWLATLLVFLLVFLVLGGLLAVFAVPLAQEGIQLAGQLPGIVADARAGRGPVGELLTRTNALQWVQDNQDRIREFGTGLGAPALSVVRGPATRLWPPSPCSCCPTWACWKDPGWWTTRWRCWSRPAPSGSAGSGGTARSPSPATSRATC